MTGDGKKMSGVAKKECLFLERCFLQFHLDFTFFKMQHYCTNRSMVITYTNCDLRNLQSFQQLLELTVLRENDLCYHKFNITSSSIKTPTKHHRDLL